MLLTMTTTYLLYLQCMQVMKYAKNTSLFMAGADTCIVRSESMLDGVPTDSTEVGITGFNGTRYSGTAGILPCFGNCVVYNKCPVNIISGHVAESMHVVTHTPGVCYTIRVYDLYCVL